MPMKSESEIRAHRDALRVAMAMPCDCRGTAHEAKCQTGLRMMKATESTLSWALGENEPLQGMVDRMGRDTRQADSHRRN